MYDSQFKRFKRNQGSDVVDIVIRTYNVRATIAKRSRTFGNFALTLSLTNSTLPVRSTSLFLFQRQHNLCPDELGYLRPSSPGLPSSVCSKIVNSI